MGIEIAVCGMEELPSFAPDFEPTHAVTLLDPANNALTIEWEESTSGDFDQYRVVLDTDANGVNDRGTGSFVANRRERRRRDEAFDSPVAHRRRPDVRVRRRRHVVRRHRHQRHVHHATKTRSRSESSPHDG